MNFEYINSELAKLRLTKLNNNLVKLSEMWFGNAAEDESLEEIADYIISSGAYGKYENDILHRFLDNTNTKNSLFTKKLKYFSLKSLSDVHFIIFIYLSCFFNIDK